MTQEQLEAAAAAASLDQAHAGLTQRFTAEKTAVDALRAAYEQAAAAGARFASINPGMMRPGSIAAPTKMARGGVVTVGGRGNKDTEPALLTPGEAVIPAEMAKKYAPIINGMIAGNIPGYKGGIGSGSEGRVGKSLPTVQRSFSGNVGASAGLVGFSAINPKDLSDLSSIYMPQIIKQAKVSVASINKEIDEWRGANIEAINAATSQVESGASSTEAFGPLTKKFKKDMEAAGGPVSKMTKTFKELTPELQKDLKEAQQYVKDFKLDIKASAEDAEKLKNALPDNKVAQMAATPGSFGALSKSRQASTAMLGGASAIAEKGSARFMLPAGLHPSSPAYKAASSQEHFSTTKVQEEQKIKLAGKRVAETQARAFAKGLTETAIDATSSVAKRTGPRRSSTDPAVKDWIANQEKTQATQDSANIAAGTSRQPRRATREADSTAPASKASVVTSRLTDNLSKVTLALSSVTGILYMFGGEMSGIAGTVSLVSAGLFGLISIVQAYKDLQIAQLAIKKYEAVADAIKTAMTAAATAGLGTFATVTSVASAAVGALVSPVLLVVAALALVVGGFILFNSIAEESRRKIEGLGAAANLSKDKLEFLAEKFEVTAKTINWAERSAAAVATSGKSIQEQQQVVDLMINPEFAEKFKTEISGIKNATKEQADLALQSLALQLRNSGFEDDAVSAVISAIAAKAERTDLNLKFNSILINDANSAKAAADLASKAVSDFNKEVAAQQKIIDQQNEFNKQDTSAYNDSTLTLDKATVEKETKAAAGVAKTSLDSLTLAFDNGSISADIYNQSISGLFDSLLSSEQPTWMLQNLAENMGLKDLVNGLTDANDVAMVLEATVAGVTVAEEDLKTLRDAAADPKNTTLQTAANKVRSKYAAETAKATREQQKLNTQKIISNNLDESNAEVDAIEAQITGYNDLVAAGMNAELAYSLIGDAAQLAAFQQAQLTDATNGNTAAVDAFIASASQLNSAKQTLAALNPVGGGGQKSSFQEAIDGLKEQQAEAKNSIMAYAKLRSAGLGVAESSKIAGDSMLAAALASQKVGSAKWNQLVTAIRAARAEEEAWLNSTPEGRAEQFADVYSKVMDVFNAQEAVLEMNNESATAANRKIIETLEKQIDAYQRRSSELERDLDKISEKEDEINKAYDEKNKSLEKVKKLNQDILNQQKSQLSIADALSQGDIGAAASAIQDSRAQNAAAQGDAAGNALDASRQAQLSALTQNGRTRAQIEAEIKQIKKDVEVIEFGALQNARNAVIAADEALATAKENLTVQGQSKTEWENINTRIDASKANAALYEVEVLKALESAKGLVGEWSKLQDTFTTTHVVNTLYDGAPAAPAPAASKTRPVSGRNLGNVYAVAKGGYIKPMAMAAGGFAKFAKGTDTVPAMLTPGEYVVNRASTKRFAPLLQAINSGNFKYSTPSGPTIPNNFLKPVYNMPEKVYAPSGGTMPLNSQLNTASSLTSQDNSVYNYSLSVNVDGTNASPDQIANVVMKKLQGIDSQRVRRQVIR
jgi:hypothetical protein